MYLFMPILILANLCQQLTWYYFQSASSTSAQIGKKLLRTRLTVFQFLSIANWSIFPNKPLTMGRPLSPTYSTFYEQIPTRILSIRSEKT